MKNEANYFDIADEGHDDFLAFVESLPEELKQMLLALGDDQTYESLNNINVICNLYGYDIDYDLSASITAIYPIK
jgi:UV DNA damage repair endonuclease